MCAGFGMLYDEDAIESLNMRRMCARGSTLSFEEGDLWNYWMCELF